MPPSPRTGRTTVCPTWASHPRFWAVYQVKIVPLAVVRAPVQKKIFP
jgi:hypothetical protein